MTDLSRSKLEPPSLEPSPSQAPRRVREIAVEALMELGREVVLLHGGERYRLRITAKGKLILTK
jgi:hemin uptake protein HemP